MTANTAPRATTDRAALVARLAASMRAGNFRWADTGTSPEAHAAREVARQHTCDYACGSAGYCVVLG